MARARGTGRVLGTHADAAVGARPVLVARARVGADACAAIRAVARTHEVSACGAGEAARANQSESVTKAVIIIADL